MTLQLLFAGLAEPEQPPLLVAHSFFYPVPCCKAISGAQDVSGAEGRLVPVREPPAVSGPPLFCPQTIDMCWLATARATMLGMSSVLEVGSGGYHAPGASLTGQTVPVLDVGYFVVVVPTSVAHLIPPCSTTESTGLGVGRWVCWLPAHPCLCPDTSHPQTTLPWFFWS